jgi:hypothetical protein
MELFAIILLGIIVISATIVMWVELSITNDRLRWLEERLTKLEKDAVKVTFTPPFTTYDEKIVIHPQVKTKPIKKRKPKSVKDWEDNFDLGGHE